ncbi:uncharacterized protein [Amphiura filiformis]|uniref:uncharacterized protein n=1 Tax=Amphiura filiformis TaxID=82378 RepID=UPI003B21A3FA
MRFEILTCEDAASPLILPAFNAKPFSIVVPAGGYVIGEGDGNIAITITRTCLPDCSNAGVVVVNTADYTATSSSDYISVQDEHVEFMPTTTATTATVNLTIVDDVNVEPDESLVMYIAIQVNGEIYHDSFTYIAITDDD